jgi:hypothetical protein
MGMYDTFYGTIKCPHCGKQHKFEEQTKSYECVLENFLLGDYVDRGNRTYTYDFETWCDETNKKFIGNIIVYKGQIVGFANENEIKNINMTKLANIEEGLGWKLDYEERCKKGIGINNDFRVFGIPRYTYEDAKFEEHPKKPGDTLIALNNNWLITEVYREILKEDKRNKCFDLYETWYRDNFVYRIAGKMGNRIARVTEDYIELMYDDGFKTEYDYENPHSYFIQWGCELVKI